MSKTVLWSHSAIMLHRWLGCRVSHYVAYYIGARCEGRGMIRAEYVALACEQGSFQQPFRQCALSFRSQLFCDLDLSTESRQPQSEKPGSHLGYTTPHQQPLDAQSVGKDVCNDRCLNRRGGLPCWMSWRSWNRSTTESLFR